MVNEEKKERIDHLFDTDLKIIQSSEVFSFSLDAVLLAKFVRVPIQRGHLVDLCTGNGAVALMLSVRTKGSITGVEIQPRLAEMARRSVEMNQLNNRIEILCADAKQAPKQLGYEKYDVVTCNPPYFTANQAPVKNPNPTLAIARHEIYLTLEEAIQSASALLKQKGKAAFVHRPQRLPEILSVMAANRLTPKRLQFIHPKMGKDANIVLVEAIKDGSEGVVVLPPIHVYNQSGEYSEELLTFAHE